MSNGGSEPSDKHDFSNMDGVPVKISENYKPPKKITPLGPPRVNPDSAPEEYDFTLENNIVSKIGVWRQIRRLNVEDRRKRIAEYREMMAKLMSPPPVNTQDSSTSLGAAAYPVVSYDHPVSSSSSSHHDSSEINSHILTPVPISSPIKETNSVARKFNFSDFESDTSSPFDNMELKTINDLEELAQCLQTQVSVGAESTPGVMSNPNGSNEESNSYLAYNSNHSFNNSLAYNNAQHRFATNCDIQAFRQMNTLPMTMHSSLLPTSQPTYIVNQFDCYNNIPPVSHPPNPNPFPPPPSVRPLVSYPNSCVAQDAAPKPAHSVPDIVLQLQGVLKDKRAAESRKKDIQSTSVPKTIKPVKSLAVSSLPNPYSSLNESKKRLCDHYVEMGFQQSRAARACQLFSDDETKVIEFLVQLQTLEDKGYPTDRAEKSFVANNYDEAATIKFLENMKQLIDLGFQEDQVCEALNKFNNDQDKALDFLVT